MENIIELNEDHFQKLKPLDIGPRIRYIREILKTTQGQDYSSRSVARRIGIISTAALGAIERGDTKEPPARVVNALANDFKVDINIFFDDYYEGTVKYITIGKVHKGSDSQQNEQVISISDTYKIGVNIYQENELKDRRLIMSTWSKTNLDKYQTLQLMSLVLQQVDIYNRQFTTNNTLGNWSNPFEQAQIEYKNGEYYNPWVPKAIRNLKRDEMLQQAKEYKSLQD